MTGSAPAQESDDLDALLTAQRGVGGKAWARRIGRADAPDFHPSRSTGLLRQARCYCSALSVLFCSHCLGPMGSWPLRRPRGEDQQTGADCRMRQKSGPGLPKAATLALSDGGTLTGIISGLPAYRGCCPATAGVGSLPPQTHKLVTCDAGRIRSPAVGNRHRKGLRFVAALCLSNAHLTTCGSPDHLLITVIRL